VITIALLEAAWRNGFTSVRPGDQRVVVVEVDFRVAVVSPVGATVVPSEVDVVPVTTPLMEVVVFSLWVSTDAAGGGTTGVVAVCVVVELDEEDCAKAPPDIRATAIVAARTRLIILNCPG
jgi:hypothetical protein